jgi:hypothetical protein
MLLFAIPATKFYMLPIARKCRYNPLDSTRHIQDGAMLSLYYIASRIRNEEQMLWQYRRRNDAEIPSTNASGCEEVEC